MTTYERLHEQDTTGTLQDVAGSQGKVIKTKKERLHGQDTS